MGGYNIRPLTRAVVFIIHVLVGYGSLQSVSLNLLLPNLSLKIKLMYTYMYIKDVQYEMDKTRGGLT